MPSVFEELAHVRVAPPGKRGVPPNRGVNALQFPAGFAAGINNIHGRASA